jgi:hypothetical protein
MNGVVQIIRDGFWLMVRYPMLTLANVAFCSLGSLLCTPFSPIFLKTNSTDFSSLVLTAVIAAVILMLVPWWEGGLISSFIRGHKSEVVSFKGFIKDGNAYYTRMFSLFFVFFAAIAILRMSFVWDISSTLDLESFFLKQPYAGWLINSIITGMIFFLPLSFASIVVILKNQKVSDAITQAYSLAVRNIFLFLSLFVLLYLISDLLVLGWIFSMPGQSWAIWVMPVIRVPFMAITVPMVLMGVARRYPSIQTERPIEAA